MTRCDAAHRLERLEQRVVRRAGRGRAGPRVSVPFVLGEREQQVLGRDVFVAERLGFVLGFVEDLVELARQRRLRVALLRIARDLARDLLAQRGDARAELLQNGNDDALVLLEERGEQMEIVDDRIAVPARER